MTNPTAEKADRAPYHAEAHEQGAERSVEMGMANESASKVEEYGDVMTVRVAATPPLLMTEWLAATALGEVTRTLEVRPLPSHSTASALPS